MMKKRLLSLLLTLALLIGLWAPALAEAAHTPYTPGALSKALFAEAFQRGDKVCATFFQSIQLDAETFDLDDDEAALANLMLHALGNAQFTVGAAKLEGGVLLDLAGTYFADGDNNDSVRFDAQLAITRAGLALTSESLLPGERVILTWEALLSMLGLSEEDSAQLLALRDVTVDQLLETLTASLDALTLTAQQFAAPYVQTVSDFIAAQTVSVEENVAADGLFPAVTQETTIAITAKSFGQLLVALCDQLEQDETLTPMLDMLLMSVAEDDESVLTTADLCAAIRAEAEGMTDEACPLYIILGSDANGEPLYLSSVMMLEDDSCVGFNVISTGGASEDGFGITANLFAMDADEAYSGLDLSMQYDVDSIDPQVFTLWMAAELRADDEVMLSYSLDVISEPILTEENMSGYSISTTVTEEINDGETAVSVAAFNEAQHALTAAGGESYTCSGVSGFTQGDESLMQTTAQVSFIVTPGENGPVGEFLEQMAMSQVGIEEAVVGMKLYTQPYAPDETLTALALDSASEEDVQALAGRLMTNAQAKIDALFELLPEELLAFFAEDAAEQEAE